MECEKQPENSWCYRYGIRASDIIDNSENSDSSENLYIGKLSVSEHMLKQLLEELIQFRTVSHDHDESRRALDWIKTHLNNLPVHFTNIESNGFPSLIITTQKTKTPDIWLQAHLDVVPASDQMFKPRYEGNKLIGRGTFDMKFAIACYMQLLHDLKDAIAKSNIGIMITTDEEIGGENGVKAVLEKGYGGKVCFLPDGGQNWEFQTWAKGVYHTKIASHGQTAHGSRPWRGKNAIETLLTVLKEMQDTFPHEPCGTETHEHDTMNIGKILGGKAANQIPDYAEALVDIRFTPKTGLEAMRKKVKKIVSKYESVQQTELVHGNSYQVDMDNHYLQAFSKKAKELYNITMGATFSHGSSDARFFIDKGIPCVLSRPIGGNLHSENEWIDVKDLEKFYIVLRECITSV